MSKVFDILEEEKQDAINKAVSIAVDKADKEIKRQFAENLIKKDMSIAFIMEVTGLTLEEVKEIQKGIISNDRQ